MLNESASSSSNFLASIQLSHDHIPTGESGHSLHCLHGNATDCVSPGLARLQSPGSSILDWNTVLYKGPGKMTIYPNNLYFRPFHILITSNKDHSLLRLQRFECRSPAAMLSLGLIGSRDLEPRDVNTPLTTWYFSDSVQKAQVILTLDICQTIRDEGAKRAEKQYNISKIAQPLTPCALSPMKNCFQIEYSTMSATSVERITLQMCDEETDEGTSLFMQHVAKHMKNRQHFLYPHCPEWTTLSDVVGRVNSKLLYNPLVCRANGTDYIQPDSLFEEMVIAAAPEAARKTLGYVNPYLCILGYRRERMICIQVFHTVQSRIFCHEHPDRKFPKYEMWIGVDEGFVTFLRLLRIYQVMHAGGDGVEYAKRVSACSLAEFLSQGQLPVDKDRVFILPLGPARMKTVLEFGFIQFSCEAVGYGKYATQIGNVVQYLVDCAMRRTGNSSSTHVQTEAETSEDDGTEVVEQVAVTDKPIPSSTSTTAEPERWAWLVDLRDIHIDMGTEVCITMQSDYSDDEQC